MLKDFLGFGLCSRFLYNTLTSNFPLRIRVVFQIRMILLRTESKIVSGAYKNNGKTNSFNAEQKKNARDFARR